MLKIKPYITEKTVSMAQKGQFTVEVEKGIDKFEIAKAIKRIFKVETLAIHFIKISNRIKKTARKTRVSDRGIRKAILTLKSGEVFPGYETFLKQVADEKKKAEKAAKANQ